MRKLRRILRSQRGDLLIESMFGAVVIAIVMATAGSVLVASAGAATGNAVVSARTILLNSVLSDEKPKLAGYTDAPKAVTGTAAGEAVTVTLWRTAPAPGTSVLNAAVSKRAGATSTDCTVPAQVGTQDCLTSQSTVFTSSAGVNTVPVTLSAGTDGALHDFTAPAGATELRYVLKVTAASADSTLTFGNRSHPAARHTVKIPSGQTGYYYGRLLVDTGSSLYLAATGTATLDPASTLIYEAPR